jgi:serine protease Do
LKPNVRLVALELEGIVFGTCPVPPNNWRPFDELNAPCVREHIVPELPKVRSLAELAVLSIQRSERNASRTSFLNLDLLRWQPEMGETVLAVGYPGLDCNDDNMSNDRPIEQYMHGSFGRIIGVEQPDLQRNRPWPMLRIDALWPGGMSGGPVFNESGNVIGVVSSGEAFTSTATYFSAWSLPQKLMPTLDPINPGRLLGYAVINGRSDVVKFGLNRKALDAWAENNGEGKSIAVSFDPNGGGWITI